MESVHDVDRARRLQGQDVSALEAARVDGATTFGIFRQITFPQLRPFLELGTLLGAIYLIQVYDHIEVIVGGQPGAKNLPFYIAQRSIGGGNRFGLASLLTWIIGLLFFFPLFWRTLNGFKEESVANGSPVLFFDPTLDRFSEVTESSSGPDRSCRSVYGNELASRGGMLRLFFAEVPKELIEAGSIDGASLLGQIVRSSFPSWPPDWQQPRCFV